MRRLEQIRAVLMMTLGRAWDRAMRLMIGDDMLAVTLLMMNIREIEEIEDEPASQENNSR